jgi:oligopeptide/dipeptide ABC transporter ATP-binding protein
VTDVILELRDLSLRFMTPLGPALAVRSVTLRVERGSVLGLVGESGCGKTMTGRAIVGLVPANARLSGEIRFDGRDLTQSSPNEIRRVRGKRIAMIFQDPSAALNPVFTIGEQLTSILLYHQIATRAQAKRQAIALLSEVGLTDPARTLNQYPHELSGGMQQRAMIAIALSASPQLLIADEPTTALDVTIQAQILDLLLRLRESRGLTVILITHNMQIVERWCDRVAVLYAGTVVEIGSVADVLRSPSHPYTQALLAALPTSAGRRKPLAVIRGRVPSSRLDIPGCVFASRCPYVMPVCIDTAPPEFQIAPGHEAACWLRKPGAVAAHS